MCLACNKQRRAVFFAARAQRERKTSEATVVMSCTPSLTLSIRRLDNAESSTRSSGSGPLRAMVYQPVHSFSHSDEANHQSTLRPLSSQGRRQAAASDAGIRAVSYDDAYDDSAFIGDERRPPSFHSHDGQHGATTAHGGSGAGLYLGDHAELTYDNILDSTRSGGPRQQYDPAASLVGTRQIYDPDLELRLDPPTPLYVNRRPTSRDWAEDVKDSADFEDSFEAGAGGGGGDNSRIEYEEDEDEHGDPLHSPALSFQGGFGAPPAVSAVAAIRDIFQ